MNKLINSIARRFGTQPDKVKHVAVSAALVLVVYIGLVYLGFGAVTATLLALGVTLIIGAGKEFADKYIGGDRSIADMAANLIGAVAMALIIWLVQVVI